MSSCLRDKVDPPIDYVGQELAKKLLYMIFTVGYGLAVAVGYFLNDFKCTLFIIVVTVCVCFLTTVPAWPFYRRHPVIFVKPKKDKKL